MKKIWLGMAVGMMVLGAALVRPVLAVDSMTVICDSVGGKCTHTPEGALFNETNMAPGQATERTLAVRNDTGEDCNITLELRVDETEADVSLADKLWLTIADGGDEFVNELLSDVNASSPYSLGTVLNGYTRRYDWTVLFDLGAGNEYQNTRAEFDFYLDVSCEPVEESTPTPTATETSSPPGASMQSQNGGDDGDGEVLGELTRRVGRIKGATSTLLSGAGSVLGSATQQLTHFPVTGAGWPLLGGGLVVVGLAYALGWRKKK